MGGKLPAGLADEVVTSLGSAVERIGALASLEEYRTDGGAEPGGAGGILGGASAERDGRRGEACVTP